MSDAHATSRQGQRGPKSGELDWTDARVTLLKQMWAEGLSQGVIAEELGLHSRGAVSGKIARLGLSGRIASTGHVPRPRRANCTAPAEPEMPIGRMTFELLTGHVCRFPTGDQPPYLFCGNPAPDGPYCASCARIAYRVA